MALTTCPDCSRKVSTEAVSCPQCGRPFANSPIVAPPTEGLFLRTLNFGCAAVIVILALLFLIALWAPRK